MTEFGWSGLEVCVTKVFVTWCFAKFYLLCLSQPVYLKSRVGCLLKSPCSIISVSQSLRILFSFGVYAVSRFLAPFQKFPQKIIRSPQVHFLMEKCARNRQEHFGFPCSHRSIFGLWCFGSESQCTLSWDPGVNKRRLSRYGWPQWGRR